MKTKKTHYLVLSTLFLLGIGSTNIKAQNINTIAGNGLSAYNIGDGGPATNAKLNNPRGIAVDASGNLYIASAGNYRIRKVTTDGNIDVFAGNGPGTYTDGVQATQTALFAPNSVAVDAAGNVYIVDYGNNAIRKVTPDGIIHTVAGIGTSGFSGDGGPAINAELDNPNGVIVDAIGNLYIIDHSNNRIRKVTTDGIINTFAGTALAGFDGDGGPATSAKLNSPRGVTVDAAGNVYIADFSNNRIRKVTTDGIIHTIAGQQLGGYTGDGGPAINAKLDAPMGIAVDAAGNIYIASYSNDCIRKITTDGVINTIAGTGISGFSGDGGPAINAELHNPVGIALDAADNIYIIDHGNNRIRMVDGGCISTSVTQNGAVLTSNASSATYQWLNCNNGYSEISGETNQIFTATSNGSYAVEVTGNSCIDTSYCFNVTSLGINTLTEPSYKLYPNPVNNELTIENPGNINKVEIYNVTGQLLETVNPMESKVIKVNLTNFVQAVYFVKIHTTNNSQVDIRKIVKE